MLAKGIRTPEEALASAHLLTPTQRVGARYWSEYTQRIPREEATAIADAVRAALDAVLLAEGVPPDRLQLAAEATACGSYRRGLPSSGDAPRPTEHVAPIPSSVPPTHPSPPSPPNPFLPQVMLTCYCADATVAEAEICSSVCWKRSRVRGTRLSTSPT